MSAPEWKRLEWAEGASVDWNLTRRWSEASLTTVPWESSRERDPAWRESVELEVTADGNSTQLDLPVEALVEALRCRGWTVTPPAAEQEPKP